MLREEIPSDQDTRTLLIAVISSGRSEGELVLPPCVIVATESGEDRTQLPVIAFQAPMVWIGVLEGLAIKGDRLFGRPACQRSKPSRAS